MKYPIGIQDFKTIRKDGFVYVDKTALLYKLVYEGKIYFFLMIRTNIHLISFIKKKMCIIKL